MERVTMTVAELITKLQACRQDAQVDLQIIHDEVTPCTGVCDYGEGFDDRTASIFPVVLSHDLF